MKDNSLPLISVIIPVYKVEQYLRRCVDSVLAQTYTNLEIILVDDGSPDSCPKMCDDYAVLDSRVKVVHKKNGGLSSARNAGLDICRGDFISFVDSDDFVSLRFVEYMYRSISERKADVCIVDFIAFNHATEIDCKRECGELSLQGKTLDEVFVLYSSLRSHDSIMAIASWNKLYKASLFDEERFPEGKLYEDALTTYKILYQCESIAFVSNPLYYYYLRSDSISGGLCFSENTMHFFNAIKETEIFFLNRNKSLYASYIVPHLLKVGLFSWWGQKFVLHQNQDAEEILNFLRMKIKNVAVTRYFGLKHKMCLSLLVKFPYIYALYRKLSPGLFDQR